jgi:hypothetical protein
MFDKRNYHLQIDSNDNYKVKSKGLIKSVRIVKNGLDPLPSSIQLYINKRLIPITKYNQSEDNLLLDFAFILEQIKTKASDYDDDECTNCHNLDMMIMAANTKSISHYHHLPLSTINESLFTHEIDIEIKTNKILFVKELKIEEEFYIPTFKLQKEEKKEEKEED